MYTTLTMKVTDQTDRHTGTQTEKDIITDEHRKRERGGGGGGRQTGRQAGRQAGRQEGRQ